MLRKNRGWFDLLVHFGKKPFILALALTISISGAVSGSLAWLTAQTAPLKNIFTIGDIEIDLDETDDGDNNPNENEYEMEIGKDVSKDPHVTVKADSKDCWVYVMIQESENFDDFLSYEFADGWKQLSDDGKGTLVYYWETPVPEKDKDQVFYVLKDNKVHVKSTVTNEMIDYITKNDLYPTMTITAYAVQYDAEIPEIADPVKAWALVAPSAEEIVAALNSIAIPEITPSPTGEEAVSMTYAQRMAKQKEDGWVAFASGAAEG